MSMVRLNDPLAAYPVGSIYMSVNSTSPATLFGGTWARITGRFLLAATDNGSSGASQAAGNTGGEATHTLTTNEMPAHNHSYSASGATLAANANIGTGIWANTVLQMGGDLGLWGFGSATQNAGGGAAHNNMPPYLAVYVWKRTA